MTIKKIMIIVLILFSIKSYSQTYTSFNFNSSGWSYVGWILGSDYMPLYEHFYKCSFDGDTLINSTTYNKFYYDVYFFPGNTLMESRKYVGAFREINKMIYFVPHDSIAEFKIYDFTNININDTIDLPLINNRFFVIDSIYVDTMLDQSLRKIYEGKLIDSLGINFGTHYKLIEGIGFPGIVPPWGVNLLINLYLKIHPIFEI